LATAHISPQKVKRIDKSTTPTLPQVLTAQALTAQVLTAQVLTAQALTGTKKAVGEGSSAP
jgi:hypothetical protein